MKTHLFGFLLFIFSQSSLLTANQLQTDQLQTDQFQTDQFQTEQLRCLTWNVWFDNKTGATRYPLILEQLHQTSADIIFLQEVTPRFLELLQASPLDSQYNISIGDPAQYTQVTLSRLPIDETTSLPLPSRYDRTGLITRVSLNGSQLSLVNVHLESGLNDDKERLEQIQQIYTSLETEAVIWAGDFNYGNDSDEAQKMSRLFKDAAQTQSQQTAFSYNIETNPLANRNKFWFEPSRRLDRIYYLNLPQFTLAEYELAIELNTKNDVILSDHFPVKANFAFKNDDN